MQHSGGGSATASVWHSFLLTSMLVHPFEMITELYKVSLQGLVFRLGVISRNKCAHAAGVASSFCIVALSGDTVGPG